jgi:hypothetical protein
MLHDSTDVEDRSNGPTFDPAVIATPVQTLIRRKALVSHPSARS